MSTLAASPRKISVWLMPVLVLVATWVRVWRFPEIPPAFNYDEAYNAVDAHWLLESNAFMVYLPGNTGRHALFHYLVALSMTALGVNVFAVRFVSMLIGILTIPLMYRWVTTMFAREPGYRFLGLVASTGLAFSFWHITLSRSGFRASLLHLLFILMAYFFWQGWRRQSIKYIIGAGVALGLSQYTYWLAGLLPLQIGLFAIILTILGIKRSASESPELKKIWTWVGIMAMTSLVVFIPLGMSYVNDPTALGYVSQSSIAVKVASGERSLGNHLLNSIRIFVDGPAGLWQGQVSQALSFDWLVLIGFWLGLITIIKRWRQPTYLFLLVGLAVLWLPAPLNDIDFSDLRLPTMLPVHHAISNLRVAGILPIYYTVVAVGLLNAVQWPGKKLPVFNRPLAARLIAFILILVISGGLNSYNFFVRWPRQPFLSERYNGPIFDLAQELVNESRSRDILIPFQLYAHPIMHFFFDRVFSESREPPPTTSHDSAVLVTTANAPISAYMWLSRSKSGAGTAYLTPNQNGDELLQFSTGQTLETYDLAAPLMITAQTTLIPNMEPLRPQLTAWPALGRVNYNWNHKISLVGYQITPAWVQPGDSINLTLYWQNLVDQPITHDVFIHVVNNQGQGVGQVDGVELTDGHRWRAGKLTPTHHTLQLGEQINPGPYLIRLGLFNARTGNRLPVSDTRGTNFGDQVLFGLFYVTDKGRQNPMQPQIPMRATLGQQIQILGYTLPTGQTLELDQKADTMLSLELYWQATLPVEGDYTIFVQLLSSQNEFITGHDTQPLNGNYPTSHWQPDEVVIEQVNLPLPAEMAAGDYRLVTGMYNYQTGQRLTATNDQGQPLNDNVVVLANIRVSSGKMTFAAP